MWNFKIFNKSGLEWGLRYKNNGDGEDLGDYQLDDGDEDSQHTANKASRGKKAFPTYLGWGPEGPVP